MLRSIAARVIVCACHYAHVALGYHVALWCLNLELRQILILLVSTRTLSASFALHGRGHVVCFPALSRAGISKLGEAAVPISLILLGNSLSAGPNWSAVSRQCVGSLIIAKMVLLPLFAFGLLVFIDKVEVVVASVYCIAWGV